MFSGMETVFKTSSSLFIRANPALVMGIFSINPLLPLIFPAPPVRTAGRQSREC
jgi:hypothetical protein